MWRPDYEFVEGFRFREVASGDVFEVVNIAYTGDAMIRHTVTGVVTEVDLRRVNAGLNGGSLTVEKGTGVSRTGQDISREADTIDLLLLNAESHAVNARQRAAKHETSMYALADDASAKPEHIVAQVKRHRLANELVEAAEAMSAAAEELQRAVNLQHKIGTIYRLSGALLDAFERFESATRALDNS